MNCYLCGTTSFLTRKGKVRDNPKLQILECRGCGLVSLSEHSHITNDFYTNSGMHGEDPISIEAWLKDTKWDDERRFRMLRSVLPNKKVINIQYEKDSLKKQKHLFQKIPELGFPYYDEETRITGDLYIQYYLSFEDSVNKNNKKQIHIKNAIIHDQI
jgi:hypothetical protein